MCNGRVDLSPEGNGRSYQLFQQKSNGSDTYSEEAIRNLQSQSLLSYAFFSKQNIDMLQNNIRYNVWYQSNRTHLISRQSDLQLQIVMRSIYLQYARNLPSQIKEQVSDLNKLVLDYCISSILSEIEQYLGYRQNVCQLPVPLERPTNVSSAGGKSLTLKSWM